VHTHVQSAELTQGMEWCKWKSSSQAAVDAL